MFELFSESSKARRSRAYGPFRHPVVLFRGPPGDPILQAARPREMSPLSLATERDHTFEEESGRPLLALLCLFAPSNPFTPVKNYATSSYRDLFS